MTKVISKFSQPNQSFVLTHPLNFGKIPLIQKLALHLCYRATVNHCYRVKNCAIDTIFGATFHITFGKKIS